MKAKPSKISAIGIFRSFLVIGNAPLNPDPGFAELARLEAPIDDVESDPLLAQTVQHPVLVCHQLGSELWNGGSCDTSAHDGQLNGLSLRGSSICASGTWITFALLPVPFT